MRPIELAIVLLAILTAVSFGVAVLVVAALVITEWVEARRARHKAVAAAGCAERSRGDREEVS